MASFEHNLQARIFNPAQHPYRHSVSEFSFTHPSIPEVTTLDGIINWLIAVIYPQTQDSVATVGDLPSSGNTIGDYRVVLDDGDGNAASYRWEQREGDVSAKWYKVYDMDWGVDSILSQFYQKTLDLYVSKRGYDDRDENGDLVTGVLAGQSIYGGATANKNLTLLANSGDGTGAATGYVQFGDNARPTADSIFSLGTTSERFLKIWTDEITVGTLTITAGSIVDSSGTIDFGDENLTTTGIITGGSFSSSSGSFGTLSLSSGSITDSSGAISFGDENLTTTGTITVGALTIATGSITDSSGTISFGDENLTTTGNITGVIGSFNEIDVDDINIDGFTIGISTLNQDLALAANGTGTVNILSAMETLGVTTTGVIGVTGEITVDNLSLNGNTLSSTDTNGDVILDPDGTGFVVLNADTQPATDAALDLGAIAKRYVDLFLSGNISDGTNSISMANLLTFRAVGSPNSGDALFWDGSKWVASAPDTEVDHGSISGLGDDDHTQYVLLAGRSGGQEIIGGTAISDNLDLESTSNATKGLIRVKSDLVPFTTASYSASWSGTDLGDPSNVYRHLYTAGEAFGLRLENLSADPSSSSQKVGRVWWNSTDSRAKIDTGTEILNLNNLRAEVDTVWDGATAQKDVDVSSYGLDATKSLWQLLDNANDYERVNLKITATTTTNVRLISNVNLPAGTYRLIGIE